MKVRYVVAQRFESALDARFDKRIVFGFLKGICIANELHHFFNDLANCADVASNARDHFQNFQDLEVHTGGLSIQNLEDMPLAIRESIQEYNNGKILDEALFQHVNQTLYKPLRNLRALKLIGKVNRPINLFFYQSASPRYSVRLSVS